MEEKIVAGNNLQKNFTRKTDFELELTSVSNYLEGEHTASYHNHSLHTLRKSSLLKVLCKH